MLLGRVGGVMEKFRIEIDRLRWRVLMVGMMRGRGLESLGVIG